MIRMSTMPKETLVELLLYLAENEAFPSVAKNLGDGVTVDDVRAALRELAVGLAREEATSSENVEAMMKKAGLSPKARKIVSALSKREEKAFLSAFGLVDN